MKNIYDYIEQIRESPGMFTRDLSLTPIEALLFGYCACLEFNEISEAYEGRTFHPRAFSAWLYDEKGWSGALGFAHAIHENTSGSADALDAFFELVQQFRIGKAPD